MIDFPIAEGKGSGMAKVRGQVKWFNNSKGYGFLSVQGQKDVFCHYSAIQSEGYKQLAENDQVEFDIIDGPKGPQASNVVVL